MISTLHNIHLTKRVQAKCEDVFNLFRDNVVFKLTGANEIHTDFKIGGNFILVFRDRGTIIGRFLNLSFDKIVLEWSVDGLNLPNERATIVTFSFKQEDQFCVIDLMHSDIVHPDSYSAKKKAWIEILDDIEQATNKFRL